MFKKRDLYNECFIVRKMLASWAIALEYWAASHSKCL